MQLFALESPIVGCQSGCQVSLCIIWHISADRLKRQSGGGAVFTLFLAETDPALGLVAHDEASLFHQCFALMMCAVALSGYVRGCLRCRCDTASTGTGRRHRHIIDSFLLCSAVSWTYISSELCLQAAWGNHESLKNWHADFVNQRSD